MTVQNKLKLMKLETFLVHKPSDPRPYIKVKILDHKFIGLLDSGATQTVIGWEGWKVLEPLKPDLSPVNTLCVVANGAPCEVVGLLNLTVVVGEKSVRVEALLVPTVRESLILGVDFWKELGLVLCLTGNAKCVNDHALSSLNSSENSRLNADQKFQLEQLKQQYFSKFPKTLGLARGVEHVIDTDGHPAY